MKECEKVGYEGKQYNRRPVCSVCPQITIRGEPFCVQKDCYHRAIGGNCPPEASEGWANVCDLLIGWGSVFPEDWIKAR